MIKYLSDEKIAEYVKDTLENPENMIKMLKKYGEVAAYHINHGQLHLDFDDRENSGWNQDIIGLFPTEKPAAS